MSQIIPSLSRRSFLKISSATGGGLLLGFNWAGAEAAEIAETASGNALLDVNAFIKVATDGTITLMSPNPEIGQNIKTTYPLIIAEELDADWSKIIVEQAPLDTTKYRRQLAGGSGSVREGWKQLREAGAAARQLFIETAAKRWKVDPSACSTEKSTVYHKASGKKATYGELANEASTMPVPTNVQLKSHEQFTLIGKKGIRNVDNKAIVTGKAQFGIDMRREGMLYAMIVRPPAFGKKLKSFDATATKAMPGIKQVVSWDNFVAVVGNTTWEAKKGRDALRVVWEDDKTLENTYEHFEKFKELTQKPAEKSSRKEGNITEGLAGANKIVEAVYEAPFLPHATLEPQNFFAHLKGEQLELVGPIQTPERTRKSVSDMLGIPESNISIMMTRMGGGFGRRLYGDFVNIAAMISKLTGGMPIQLVYTREDDMLGGIYRPEYYYSYKGGLDENKQLTAWHLCAAGIGGGGVRENNFPAGSVPNFQVDFHPLSSNVTTGAWRAPVHNFCAFAEESFVDEMAHAAGKDPVQFRLELLDKAKNAPVGNVTYNIEKYKRVVEMAAEKSGWGKPKPEGIYQGFGAHFSFGSYVAQVADISIENGQVRVHKVTCVVDCGTLINVSGAEHQIEGGITDGLGHALYGELLIENGVPNHKNFDTYRLIRMKEAPTEIEVHFVPGTEHPQGLGEPGLPPIAAAVGNAIFAATGQRIRKLPFTLQGITG